MNDNKCYKCNNNYKIIIRNTKRIYNNLIVIYDKKYCICNNCNIEFFDESVIDYNVDSFNNAYNNIFINITKKEIYNIIKLYNINYNILLKLLNTNNILISKLIDNNNVDKCLTNKLQCMLNSPFFTEILLINENKLNGYEKKIMFNSINRLKLEYNDSKIYVITNYIIDKVNNLTTLSLQKLLYFINGFSTIFNDNNIFSDNCYAWENGPVYKTIYNCYSSYKYPVKSNKLFNYNTILTNLEINIIDKVIEYYSIYDDDTLVEMTHITEPWNNAYNNNSSNININDIKKYFILCKQKYKIDKIDDIKILAYSFLNIINNNN